LSSAFEDDLAGYADAASTAVELWLTKLETYLETHSLDEVKSIAAERGLQFAAAAFQGGLLVSQGDARREAWAQLERRLELCRALAVPTLVVAPDFVGPFDATDIERAQISLKRAGQAAEKHGVRIALEFQARGTFLTNLETAASFVQSVEQPNVGLCFDVFHYYMGPSMFEDLAYLGPHNLFHVQLCDVADTPREMATDADRILPGDGDFQLQPLVQRFREIGYAGYVSLEVMNPTFWQVSARQVGEVGLTALRMLLGLNKPA
jgi:sugar phosphate isomerase/epimerase